MNIKMKQTAVLKLNERMRGVTKQKRDGKVDSISASIILERWIDSKSNEKSVNCKYLNIKV